MTTKVKKVKKYLIREDVGKGSPMSLNMPFFFVLSLLILANTIANLVTERDPISD